MPSTPAGRAPVMSVAVPFGWTAACPTKAMPFRKTTNPVGAAPPLTIGFTVAVKVILLPRAADGADEVRIVFVGVEGTAPMVTIIGPPMAGLKEVSPL